MLFACLFAGACSDHQSAPQSYPWVLSRGFGWGHPHWPPEMHRKTSIIVWQWEALLTKPGRLSWWPTITSNTAMYEHHRQQPKKQLLQVGNTSHSGPASLSAHGALFLPWELYCQQLYAQPLRYCFRWQCTSPGNQNKSPVAPFWFFLLRMFCARSWAFQDTLSLLELSACLVWMMLSLREHRKKKVTLLCPFEKSMPWSQEFRVFIRLAAVQFFVYFFVSCGKDSFFLLLPCSICLLLFMVGVGRVLERDKPVSSSTAAWRCR